MTQGQEPAPESVPEPALEPAPAPEPALEPEPEPAPERTPERTPEPVAAVIEWGGQRPGRLDRFAHSRWWDPRIAPVLAGLGGAAVLGSFVAEWQLLSWPGPSSEPPGARPLAGDGPVPMGVGEITAWGTAWVAGVMLLAGFTALVFLGQPTARAHARIAGLAAAGVLGAFLVAAAVDLSRRAVFTFELGLLRFIGGDEAENVEVGLGRGLYLALASVVLLGVALYLAKPRPPVAAAEATASSAPARPEQPAQSGSPPQNLALEIHTGPDDLTVAPAEPFTRLGNRYEWR